MRVIRFPLSLLMFGLPAHLLVEGFHAGMPYLVRLGMLPYYAYVLGIGVPLAVLFASAALLFINIVGEEFWWRGIVLPGQKRAAEERGRGERGVVGHSAPYSHLPRHQLYCLEV